MIVEDKMDRNGRIGGQKGRLAVTIRATEESQQTQYLVLI